MVPRRKILHVITHLDLGGATDNTLLTLERHDRARFEVHLAANPRGHWGERARRACDVFHAVPALRRELDPLHDSRALASLARISRRERFDLVHTHTAKAGLLGRLAARATGVRRVVHTYHSFPFHDHLPVATRRFYVQLERSVRPCTSALLTVCEYQRREALRLRLGAAATTRTVYSGIDLASLDAPTDSDGVRASLGLARDAPVVLTVGRLDAQKAVHLLLEAFTGVAAVHPDAVLLVAGDGPLRRALVRRADALGCEGSVRFLGVRDDVPALLRAADVFALSSLWEGLGRAMTEAMLLGKPVVVPAVCGIPDVVEHRRNGLLFPPGDVAALRGHLLRVLAHPAEAARLGRAARRRTRGAFGADLMVQRIEAIYEALFQGAPLPDPPRGAEAPGFVPSGIPPEPWPSAPRPVRRDG